MICIEPQEMKEYFEDKMEYTTLGPFNRDEVRQIICDYLEQQENRHYGVLGVCGEGSNQITEGCRGP